MLMGGRKAKPDDATSLTKKQGHKRLDTLEQLLDVFVRTTTLDERTAFTLDVAKSHIDRACAAIDRDDAGSAAESSAIAAAYIASTLDRTAQQRLLSSFGGKQTRHLGLKQQAVKRAKKRWKSDPDRSVLSIAKQIYSEFNAESLDDPPVERTIRRWIQSSKP